MTWRSRPGGRWRRLLDDAHQAFVREGAAGVVVQVFTSGRGFVTRLVEYALEWSVDQRFGIRTRGIARPDFAATRSMYQDQHYYQATRPWILRRYLERLPISDYRTFTFVDLGAGRGLACITAATSEAFNEVIAVELDPDLSQEARYNATQLRAIGHEQPRIVVFQSDAAGFQPPRGDLVVYLFNPFGPETLRACLERLGEWRQQNPRARGFIIYQRPAYRSVLDAQPWLRTVYVTKSVVIYAIKDHASL